MDGEPWTDHVIKGSPARRDFPTNPPKLTNLILLRIMIAPSRIHIVVRFSSLPEDTPPKWAERNYHQLDLVFQFRLPKLVVFDVDDYLKSETEKVSIIIDRKKFKIYDANMKDIVILEFESVYAVFVPDETRQFDEMIYHFVGSDIETY